MPSNRIDRRTVLRSAGVAVTLPWLELSSASGAATAERPRRMVAIMTDLGVIPDNFFPDTTGRDYRLSKYLETLRDHRDRFTVFSGLSHPEVDGGHQTDQCFLTGAPHPRKPNFRNSISLDQFAAQSLGSMTRFPTLSLRVGPVNKTLSYSADGVALPSEQRPSAIFRKLFLQGSPREVEERVAQLQQGRSLMDRLGEQIASLKRRTGNADSQRLDQYLAALREVEQRLHETEQWEHTPKPLVDVSEPKDELDPAALVERTRAIYDLTRLAIQTDSTRLVTIFVTQQFNPKVDLPGVEIPHHALTHQMSLAESRRQLEVVETAQMVELRRLLDGLHGIDEAGSTLLDSTMVLYGSNLGNASKHDTKNLPVLLAGGRFRHGGHLAFDARRNTPLANLYVSMLQQLGVETDRFSTATGTLSGLEAV